MLLSTLCGEVQTFDSWVLVLSSRDSTDESTSGGKILAIREEETSGGNGGGEGTKFRKVPGTGTELSDEVTSSGLTEAGLVCV